MIGKRREAIGETTTPGLRLALPAALRDGDFGDRQSVREERRDDRQEGREERRDDRQEARTAIRAASAHELLRLASSCGRLATGILEIGSRSERNVATMDERRERNVGMIGKRSERRSGRRPRVVTPCEFLRRCATGILEIGSWVDEERRDDQRRGARDRH